MKIKLFLVSICGLVVLLASFSGKEEIGGITFHSPEEQIVLRKLMGGGGPELIEGENELFMASFKCSGCHGFDPLAFANVDTLGNDINLVDDWRATMMANAAKDPFWRAKVSHEVLVNPAFETAIETKCTSCHAPLGHFNAFFIGEDHYTMDDLLADSVALDGVSCAACHQQSPFGIGNSFSGELYFEEDYLFGPYENPFGGPMSAFVGFIPTYSPHIMKSETCAGCHTLLTETFGTDGIPTGTYFTEQGTYHEWVNSAFNTGGLDAIECQGCHMPAVEQDVVIASGNLFLPTRNPYYLHGFAGGNSYMLEMFKNNIDTLDLRALPEQFDSTIQSVMINLQEETLDIFLTEVDRTEDTAYFEVKLINKAGHKFPTGYPSRRAFVEFIVVGELGDTLFHSGELNSDQSLADISGAYEPHYNVINSADQVQIYEMVMGDTDGNKTTILLRANEPLKDNRLVPLGFSTSHPSYDTVLVAGNVLNDTDFNYEDGMEGSGSDIIHYHIPMNGSFEDVVVRAKIYFQVIPPEWNEELFSANTTESNFFQDLYNAQAPVPVLMGEQSLVSMLSSVETLAQENNSILVYPNPTIDGRVRVRSLNHQGFDKIEIRDVSGKLLIVLDPKRRNEVDIQLPNISGSYFISTFSEKSRSVKRVLVF